MLATDVPCDWTPMLTFQYEGGFRERHFQTSFYTFSLPIRLGMYLANIRDPGKHRAAEAIALQIGHIFQVSSSGPRFPVRGRIGMRHFSGEGVFFLKG